MKPSLSSILARAARAGLQWRLLLLWTVCAAVPGAVLTLPVWRSLDASLGHSVHAQRLARALDLMTITDLLGSHASAALAVTSAGLVAGALALLLSPLMAAAVAGAARAPAPLPFGDLLRAALAGYGPMLRMLLWSALPLGTALALGGAALDWAEDSVWGGVLAWLALALLALLAHASVDAGRAALALDPTRRSALAAWRLGCFSLARRPFALLGVYVAISAAGLLLAGLLALARVKLPYLGSAGLAGGFVLTQLIVVVLGWMRAARLFALVDIHKM